MIATKRICKPEVVKVAFFNPALRRVTREIHIDFLTNRKFFRKAGRKPSCRLTRIRMGDRVYKCKIPISIEPEKSLTTFGGVAVQRNFRRSVIRG